jgi:hypothetical protein
VKVCDDCKWQIWDDHPIEFEYKGKRYIHDCCSGTAMEVPDYIQGDRDVRQD